MEKENNRQRLIESSDEFFIRRMGLSDIERIKQFVLAQYELLEEKDYFIISDIDTELPIILKNGIVVALLSGENIIGIEAIDTNMYNGNLIKAHISKDYSSNSDFYELGWVMIRNDYRRRGYAVKLFEMLGSFFQPSEKYVLVVTVHPSNNAAYRLFNRLGFTQVSHSEWYGYDRIFMIKENC